MGLTLVADGRALKKRWFRLLSASSSAKTAAEPAQKANDLLWSWLAKPLGDDVVVPITVCNASVEWCARGLCGERVAGLRRGVLLDGVILRDDPGPATLPLPLTGVLAIARESSMRVQ